jgi:hypothetical protein
MERAGILLIGIAAVIYTLSTAYIEIGYMHIHQQEWEQTP